MHQPGESSVEEILDSIKKVIARDNREGAIAERRRRTRETQPEPADAEEAEEVLELDEDAMVALGESGESGTLANEADTFGEDDSERDGANHGSGDHEPLTRDTTREAMRANFEALATLAAPGAPPRIVRSGETSLEGMVRDMLRPMLAEWLDENLPGMVEDLVKAEIARIAGKRK